MSHIILGYCKLLSFARTTTTIFFTSIVYELLRMHTVPQPFIHMQNEKCSHQNCSSIARLPTIFPSAVSAITHSHTRFDFARNSIANVTECEMKEFVAVADGGIENYLCSRQKCRQQRNSPCYCSLICFEVCH